VLSPVGDLGGEHRPGDVMDGPGTWNAPRVRCLEDDVPATMRAPGLVIVVGKRREPEHVGDERLAARRVVHEGVDRVKALEGEPGRDLSVGGLTVFLTSRRPMTRA
jgi:hypothetical protein